MPLDHPDSRGRVESDEAQPAGPLCRTSSYHLRGESMCGSGGVGPASRSQHAETSLGPLSHPLLEPAPHPGNRRRPSEESRLPMTRRDKIQTKTPLQPTTSMLLYDPLGM